MNTWAFAPRSHNRVPQPLRTFRTPGAGELLVLGLNAFVNAVLPLGVVRRRRLRGDPMRAYRAPFPDRPSRAPILAFPRDIPMGPGDRAFDRMKRTEDGLGRLERPALLVWGMRDPVFPPRVMKKFRERLPSLVEEVHYDDASHFLQEDKGPDIGRAIRRFVTDSSP
jgi:haloalkane dehalogenase